MESGPFTGLRLCLLLGAANAFRVSLALNTYTSVELAYATSYFTALNGTWTWQTTRGGTVPPRAAG